MSQELVFIGGGHSHAIALNLWAQKALVDPSLAKTQVTLISPQALTPYSGMLPGLIAGHYSLEQTHINLPALCNKANARFIQSFVTAINPDQQTLQTADGQTLSFDLASINTGITPNTDVPGATEFAVGVKPIASFYPRWQALLKNLRNDLHNTLGNDLSNNLSPKTPNNSHSPYRIAVVGGGAAGVEMILAMQYALSQELEQALVKRPIEFTLIQSGKELPAGYPHRLQQKIQNHLHHKQINLFQETRVTEVQAQSLNAIHTPTQQIHTLAFDTLFWCTQAGAASWPGESGIITDDQGFICVNDTLQTLTHPKLFACGDIASQAGVTTPKAGVFAVRQGPVLFHNLCASLLDQPLKTFHPQSAYLSLLAAGDNYAWGCRLGQSFLSRLGLPSVAGRWVWHWKDAIDRGFMQQFPP